MTTPFRVLFSNDTTNILTCKSPYNARGAMALDPQTNRPTYQPCDFTAEKIRATVDETAGMGIDVHLLQPGLGWVPWWKSAVYPFARHIVFMKRQTGMDPDADPCASYMASGGDVVEVFVRRCREKGMAPFISFRLNDSHGHEFLTYDRKDIPAWAWHCFSPVHVEHPDWRLKQDLREWNGRVLNWAIPDVRAHKLAFIREIIEQYDIDGFELDFMRHCNFFRLEETTGEERRRVMTGFVGEVRALLDRTSPPGRRRRLCVRIPAYSESHDALGIDVTALADAGVEMFNLSHYYFIEQQGDWASIRQKLPHASVYLEMCHCTSIGPSAFIASGYDNFTFRRTTPNQYYTTAHLAYARGLQGVSTFNFVYYREHGVGERGPFNEPPFEVHRGCADPDFVARQPQHYFTGNVWDAPHLRSRPLPCLLKPGGNTAFDLDMAPPAGGWQEGGRVRIQCGQDLGRSRWAAELNGVSLTESPDRSEPYGNLYSPMTGAAEQHRAWAVPPEILRNGINRLDIHMLDGLEQARLVFVDATVE